MVYTSRGMNILDATIYSQLRISFIYILCYQHHAL